MRPADRTLLQSIAALPTGAAGAPEVAAGVGAFSRHPEIAAHAAPSEQNQTIVADFTMSALSTTYPDEQQASESSRPESGIVAALGGLSFLSIKREFSRRSN
jgi:hypothetical protein